MSALVARILGQLTLTAWLPAALLTASVAVLVELRKLGSADVGNAVGRLTSSTSRFLILVVPCLILATLLTQAFSFEAIRALEGYWGSRGPIGWYRTALIRHHVRRKRRLEERRLRAMAAAFARIRSDLIRDSVPSEIVNALEAEAHGQVRPKVSDQHAKRLAAMTWRDRCLSSDLAKVDHLLAGHAEYPRTARVLPTRLGNVLRSTEDSLAHAGQDIEGYAMRRRDLATPRVRQQHDQFRSRLDMYCTMVFVAGFLAALSATMLASRLPAKTVAIAALLFVALAVASYGAAIASAKGYCTTLRMMDRDARPEST